MKLFILQSVETNLAGIPSFIRSTLIPVGEVGLLVVTAVGLLVVLVAGSPLPPLNRLHHHVHVGVVVSKKSDYLFSVVFIF